MPGMTPESAGEDARIGELLRADAPPAHDPMFRISVLERHERKQFRNRSLMALAAALAFVAVSSFAISAGGRVYETVAVVLVASVAVAAYLIYAPALAQMLRRFRI